MTKINNKIIVFALGIIAILALGAVVPMTASAYDEGVTRPYNAPNPANTAYLYQTPQVSYQPQSAGYYYNPSMNQPQTTAYYTPPAPQVVYVNTPAKTVYKTTASTTASNTSTSTNNSTDASAVSYTDKYSTLAASAVLGGNTFAPSGLVQWILLAILILIIIIISRRIFGATDRYNKSPLKHA
jgi:hypothetical protein